MKLTELKTEIQKYQYMEDTQLIDVSLASIIATRLKIGNPVWLIIIGASSGGKSQMLRPLALTDEKFIHRIDDLTENTFLSGIKSKEGEVSLLNRIGSRGIIVISDLTVLFSKQAESRAVILSQFRMVYDGEMTKFSGNSSKPISWKGSLGVLAGSTPSIYQHFEEVADMGERFIYYRMKEFDPYKATHLALTRKSFGKDLDDKLSSLYEQYIKEVVKSYDDEDIELSEEVNNRIIEVSMFAEKVRTVAHKDRWKDTIDRKPTPAMPMRVALQLVSIAKALAIIQKHETGKNTLTEQNLSILDWCGYSLANEEKRHVLKVIASVAFDKTTTTSTIADIVGLSTSVIGTVLQNLSAVGVLTRTGDGSNLYWAFKNEKDYNIVRRIEHITDIVALENRQTLVEEDVKQESMMDDIIDDLKDDDVF